VETPVIGVVAIVIVGMFVIAMDAVMALIAAIAVIAAKFWIVADVASVSTVVDKVVNAIVNIFIFNMI
jgi:hypothetical protein